MKHKRIKFGLGTMLAIFGIWTIKKKKHQPGNISNDFGINTMRVDE